VGVKKGYKLTEVGVIPEDWEPMPLSEIGHPVRGGSPRPAGDPRYFDGAYIPWLTVAALTNIPHSQLIVNETATCLTEEGSLHSRTLEPGTLIIANSGATLGVAKILGMQCCANDGVAALLNLAKSVSPFYLAHFINTKTDYLRDVVATGNGQPNLNTTLIGDFNVPFPPTKAEQEAIAEELSDADALIESLEHLLAKKRDIKQGAMQELLTGKRRLRGFTGKWELYPLRKFVLCFIVPMRDKPKRLNGVIPWCRIEDFDGIYLDGSKSGQGVDTHTIQMMNLKVYPVGTLLVSCSADLGRCAIVSRPLISNQTFIGLDMDHAVSSNLFFYYYMTSIAEELNNLSSGTTISYLSREQFEEFGVFVPLDKGEQTAIADVLSDMDNEIDALEARLTKVRQLKQGMMQELLTGRIRLV
jgi:type I restriction enzyme S subunit